MNGRVEDASRWIYRGVWAVLVRWFRVPDRPPTLPLGAGETLETFRPSEGFLRLLKLKFWILLGIIDFAIFFAWLVITIAFPIAGVILALPALAIAVLPDIVAYVALHLQYDTTWYVMTRRSLRIRRGIWVIHETTITFENVQDIKVHQGPIERLFGISNVLVETAGGGAPVGAENQPAAMTAHRGLIQGVSDASRIRDLILARLKHTRTAGLGDELEPTQATAKPGWRVEQIALLRDIRDLAVKMAARTGTA
jgi:membrane protein YdbS with pleckstrin-like domain